MVRKRSRSRSKTRDDRSTSSQRAESSRCNWLQVVLDKFSPALFYVATLPATFKSRRELFTLVKCVAFSFFWPSLFFLLGFENIGIRFAGGFLAFVNLVVMLGVQFCSPKVVVKADAKTKDYSGSAHQRTLASVYVAHTGYYNVDGSPNYGLFSSSFISAG